MPAPIVFVSYSHDSDDHKTWVLQLATYLRENGVDVVLDVWDLKAGQDIVAFMSKGISTSDRVVMVCSDNYVVKADGQKGGVGFEGLIITGGLVENLDTHKFIPIIRGNPTKKMPTSLGPRKYIDFSNEAALAAKREELLREIHGQPSYAKPPLRPNPFSATTTTAQPARMTGPSGLTLSGNAIVADDWFSVHSQKALDGLANTNWPERWNFGLRFTIRSRNRRPNC